MIDPIRPEDILFSEQGHIYYVRGEAWTSVTTVLDAQLNRGFANVDPEVLRRAREWGTAVHDLVQFHEDGDLDVDALAPELREVLRQYSLAKAHYEWTALAWEMPVAHCLHRYAGRLDLIVQGPGYKALVDIKSGLLLPSVRPQTAAYLEAYQSMKLPGKHKITRRYVLQLERGTYRVRRLQDSQDFSIFVSCLNVMRFMESAKV